MFDVINVMFYICWLCNLLWFLVNDQLGAQFFSMYLFHFSKCFEQPCAHHQENQLYQYSLWYMSLCVGDRVVCRSERNFPTCTRHSDIYQRLYWYNWFSWWWAQGCSKHVEKWNKYIEKNCAPSWSFTKNNVMCFKWVYGQWMNSWVHATMQFVYLSLWHLFQWHEQPSPQHIHVIRKTDTEPH